MSELLLADYTRRGIFDGIGIRLPTICIRPGKPNRAASGFFSGILREPLIGMEAALPVPEDVRRLGMLHRVRRLAFSFTARRSILHRSVPTAIFPCRASAPRSASRSRHCAGSPGDKAVKLIRREPDELVMRIVSGWAQGFTATRARELGFVAESSFDEIIRAHIDDELEGRLP